MIFRILLAISAFLISYSLGFGATSNDASMMSSVLKLKTYERNVVDGSYIFTHYGSAVLVDGKKLVTNAHVVLDSNGDKPTGYYEVCRTEGNKKIPTCFAGATLLYYDKIEDLAVLELSSVPKSVKPVTISDTNDITIGKNVVVYGYPAIGGYTITRTEGKIGGFDKDNYKFDGTIDHGNSGGGAFDANGKFIGVPFAVSSDNGVIGYIIPASKVKEFLAKKTDSIENFTSKIQTTFAPYIKSAQAIFAKPNAIKTKYIDLKNAEKNGFTLMSAVTSIDSTIFTYKFIDKNERVIFSIGCSKDAQTTWKNSIEYEKAVYALIQTKKDAPSSVTEIAESNSSLYVLYALDKQATKGERGGAKMVFYKDAPTCSAIILGSDPEGKDKTSFDRAYQMAKAVKFTKTPQFTTTFTSPYFTAAKIPKNYILSEVALFTNGNNISPYLSLISEKGNETVSSDFSLLEFENVGGYLEYGSSESKTFSEPSYSFQTFFDTYKTTGYANVSDVALTAKNGKKIIMTISDYSNTDVFPAKYEKYVTFFYPFVATSGEYRAYKFTFIFHTSDDSEIFGLRDFMESLELPGKSPFTN